MITTDNSRPYLPLSTMSPKPDYDSDVTVKYIASR